MIRAHAGLAALTGLLALAASPACAEDLQIADVARAADFVRSEGVQTHIGYTDGRYARLDLVLSHLAFLGIDHVRDGLNAPGQFGSAPLSAYQLLARAGVKFVFGISGIDATRPTGTPTNPSLDQRIAVVAEMQRSVPGSVIAVEGPNEINNWPVAYDGLGQSHHGQDALDAALHYQSALYRRVHADPDLKGVPVYFFTGYGAGGVPAGPDPATTAGLADYDTQHPYPNNGDPPATWVARRRALSNETADNAARHAPAVYTETGYAAQETRKGGVSLDVQAKYVLDLYLDTAQAGIAGTYIYELMDAYAPGSRQGNDGWGLFDYRGQAKPVALAIRAMNAILHDPGPAALSFHTSPLRYAVQGGSATGNSLALQKSDGSFVLALWDEQPIWDGRSAKAIAAQTRTVTVSFSLRRIDTADLYDPMRGIDVVARYHAADSIAVELSDHPVFLLIRFPASRGGYGEK